MDWKMTTTKNPISLETLKIHSITWNQLSSKKKLEFGNHFDSLMKKGKTIEWLIQQFHTKHAGQIYRKDLYELWSSYQNEYLFEKVVEISCQIPYQLYLLTDLDWNPYLDAEEKLEFWWEITSIQETIHMYLNDLQRIENVYGSDYYENWLKQIDPDGEVRSQKYWKLFLKIRNVPHIPYINTLLRENYSPLFPHFLDAFYKNGCFLPQTPMNKKKREGQVFLEFLHGSQYNFIRKK